MWCQVGFTHEGISFYVLVHKRKSQREERNSAAKIKNGRLFFRTRDPVQHLADELTLPSRWRRIYPSVFFSLLSGFQCFSWCNSSAALTQHMWRYAPLKLLRCRHFLTYGAQIVTGSSWNRQKENANIVRKRGVGSLRRAAGGRNAPISC